MTIISAFCFLFFLMLFLSLFKKGTDIFSPARLFLLIWTLAIGLADLKLSRYQIHWSTYSWFMLLISLLSFLVGVFVIYVINMHKPIESISNIRSTLISIPINSSFLFRAIITLFIAYIISYIVSYLIIGFVPVFARFPGRARNDWGIFGFGLFIQAFPSIIFFIVLYFRTVKGKIKHKVVLAIISIVSLLTYSLLLQRYYVVFAILVSTIFMYYTSRVFSFKNIMILLCIILIVFFGMSSIRLTGTILNYLYYLSDMKYSLKYAIFTEPYMYIVMNLENFANAVDKFGRFSGGVFTFDFIFALAGIKHLLAEYMHQVEFPHIVSNNYNTYTMFFIYYRDFGILGLGIVPFIIGSLFSAAYYKMRQKPTIKSVSLYSIFAFVIFFSFFVPIISFLHFVFNLFLIYLVTRVISQSSNLKQLHNNPIKQ